MTPLQKGVYRKLDLKAQKEGIVRIGVIKAEIPNKIITASKLAEILSTRIPTILQPHNQSKWLHTIGMLIVYLQINLF